MILAWASPFNVPGAHRWQELLLVVLYVLVYMSIHLYFYSPHQLWHWTNINTNQGGVFTRGYSHGFLSERALVNNNSTTRNEHWYHIIY